MEQDRLNHIKEMQDTFARVKEIAFNLSDAFAAYEDIQSDIPVLEEYLDSEQWLRDFEAIDNGEVPKELQGGVFSEDYDLNDLFVTIVCLHDKFKTYFKDWNEFPEEEEDN